jgi:hypothetical protein
VRRLGRVRGDTQVVMVDRAQSFSDFVKRFRFHLVAFQRQSTALARRTRAGVVAK